MFKTSSEENNKNNIMYKPELDYDKKYDTNYYSDNINEEKNKETVNTKLENLKKDVTNVYSLLSILPPDLSAAVKNTLVVVKSATGDIKDVNEQPKKIEEIVEILSEDNEDDNENEDDYPSDFFDDKDEIFKITINEPDKIELIKDMYNYDITSIFSDYIKKLQYLSVNYIKRMLSILDNITSNNLNKILNEYTGSTNDVSLNNKHLSDAIIRSQISRKMKTKFYNKKFGIDDSIFHLRLCKVGIEQRIRYYEEEYLPSINYENAMSNRTLEVCRMQYDKKYKENFTNLYKYLNSSVELLNECLKMHLTEIEAKSILMKKEGKDLWK